MCSNELEIELHILLKKVLFLLLHIQNLKLAQPDCPYLFVTNFFFFTSSYFVCFFVLICVPCPYAVDVFIAVPVTLFNQVIWTYIFGFFFFFMVEGEFSLPRQSQYNKTIGTFIRRRCRHWSMFQHGSRILSCAVKSKKKKIYIKHT